MVPVIDLTFRETAVGVFDIRNAALGAIMLTGICLLTSFSAADDLNEGVGTARAQWAAPKLSSSYGGHGLCRAASQHLQEGARFCMPFAIPIVSSVASSSRRYYQ